MRGLLIGTALLPATLAQTVDITSPAGGENWTVGQPVTVEWTYSGLPGDRYASLMVLTASDDFGAGLVSPVMLSQQQVTFTLPEWLPDASDYAVMLWVGDGYGFTYEAQASSPTLSITGSTEPWTFGITSPVANEILSADPAENPHDVQWSGCASIADAGVYVMLMDGIAMLSPYGLYGPPAPTVADGSFALTFPQNIGNGTDYRLVAQVVLPGDFAALDFSPAFEIADSLARPGIEVTALSNGGQWQADESVTVEWSITGTLLGGEDVFTEAPGAWVSSPASDDAIDLCLHPQTAPGDDYHVVLRLMSSLIMLAHDVSDVITVAAVEVPEIELTWPVVSATLEAGSTYTITWDTVATEGSAIIDLYKGGEYFHNIAWLPPGDGACEWTVFPELEPADDYAIAISYYWDSNCAGGYREPAQLSEPITIQRASVSGTVENAVGDPLSGILVEVRRPGEGSWDELVAYAVTNENGAYSILGIPVGDYLLRAGGELESWVLSDLVTDPASGHAYQHVHTVQGFDTAQRLCAVSGGHLAAINSQEENDFILQTLEPIGATFGAYYDTDLEEWTWVNGDPFGYSNWADYQPDYDGGIDYAAEWWDDGTWGDIFHVDHCVCEYELGPVPLPNYARTYYPGTPYSPEAELISLAAGQNVVEMDFALAEGSVIQGQVRDESTGEPLAGIDVMVWPSHWNGLIVPHAATTDADGYYQVHHLPNDSYFVMAAPDPESDLADYIFEIYDDALCPDGGTPLIIDSPQVADGVDFDLTQGSTISGTVTYGGIELGGVDVRAAGEFCSWHRATVTDEFGDYTIRALPPDTYAVFAHPSEDDDCAWRAYQDKPCMQQADWLTIASGMHVSGVDFALTQAGLVTGTVYDEDTGEPLAGIDICVHWWDGESECDVSLVRHTDFYGHYVANLHPGTYVLEASRHGYYPEYHGGAHDPQHCNRGYRRRRPDHGTR